MPYNNMKLIIPMAGKGTRLRPHTFTTPKALVELAGSPMLAHVLDSIKELNFDEAIFVVDQEYLGLGKYLTKRFGFKVSFVMQKERLGNAHAIYLTKQLIKDDSDVFVLFADTLIEANLKGLKRIDFDGVIWTKEVDDPRKYGVVFKDGDVITKIIEKPEVVDSNEAIVGMYYFKSSAKLFESIETLIDEDMKTKGEYQLADAIDLMIRNNSVFKSSKVKIWQDCGTIPSLLEANEYLLRKLKLRHDSTPKTSVIINPVFIDKGAQIKNSIIGPNVSVGKDVIIENSILKNSILGDESKVLDVTLKDSVIGKKAKVSNSDQKRLNVGDWSEVLI